MDKLGDRTLACWLGYNKLYVTTYNFDWFGGHNYD